MSCCCCCFLVKSCCCFYFGLLLFLFWVGWAKRGPSLSGVGPLMEPFVSWLHLGPIVGTVLKLGVVKPLLSEPSLR